MTDGRELVKEGLIRSSGQIITCRLLHSHQLGITESLCGELRCTDQKAAGREGHEDHSRRKEQAFHFHLHRET
jgi:hypothetical protein